MKEQVVGTIQVVQEQYALDLGEGGQDVFMLAVIRM